MGLALKPRSFPFGLETHIGRELENGVELSSGQWQRLAIARALARLQTCDLLILDEPSAALDACKVIVLDKGRVLETGSHEELLAQRGHYSGILANEGQPFGYAQGARAERSRSPYLTNLQAAILRCF